MDPKKAREILRTERPDLIDVERKPSAPPAEPATDVDRSETSTDAWRKPTEEGDETPMKGMKHGLSADEIRQMFAPRPLGGEPQVEVARGADEVPGIRRVIKRGHRGEFEQSADSGGPEAKDILLDEENGVIGSQG